MVDNYDSFTFNLVHYLEASGDYEVDVYRNDKLDEVDSSHYQKIILSPGPGLPEDAGGLMQFIEKHKNHKQILGVCLGMQALALAFNSPLKNLEQVYHGVKTPIQITDSKSQIFRNLPGEFQVGRYHSWVVDREKLSDDFQITGLDENGELMAFQHKSLPLIGLQFHPESILSELGQDIINNWLELTP